MTRIWSNKSLEQYRTLDPRLQDVLDYLLANVADISIIKGYRGEEEQNAAYERGASQLKYPHGKHNKYPSIAVDVAPYPYPQKELELWAGLAYIAGSAVEYAKTKGIKLRWGGDWDMDGDLTENGFDDLFHLEIVD